MRRIPPSSWLMTELKAYWCRVQKLLGRSRDKAGNLIPGWTIVQRRPTYVITRQLTRWTQLSQLKVSDGSQRSIEGYFSSRVPPPPENRQTRHRSFDNASSAPVSDAADAPPCARRPCAYGRASPSEPPRRRRNRRCCYRARPPPALQAKSTTRAPCPSQSPSRTDQQPSSSGPNTRAAASDRSARAALNGIQYRPAPCVAPSC